MLQTAQRTTLQVCDDGDDVDDIIPRYSQLFTLNVTMQHSRAWLYTITRYFACLLHHRARHENSSCKIVISNIIHHQVNCTGGVPLPAPIYDLPCSMQFVSLRL